MRRKTCRRKELEMIGREGKLGTVSTLPALIDIEEVALLLAVSERHVRRLVFERRIPYIKWGRLLRFDPSELRRWLDEGRRQVR